MAFTRRKIKTAETLGELLRRNRRKNKITLEQAEESTKIRQKYLKAIEGDDWGAFSSRVYALGFVRRYSDFLGLNGKQLIDEHQDEFIRIKSKQVRLNAFGEKISTFAITPKLLISSLSIILVLSAAIYIGYSVKNLSNPPFINIISPLDENAQSREVVIEGKTNDTAVVDINGLGVSIDENGYFNQKVVLEEGLNLFEIKSTNRLGKQSSKMLRLYFKSEAN
ncbi:MAG: hypothetical protein BWY43_00272 [candidate division WS2 bacterium ADurb.Bin280]|uniref:Helix-turn-helix domain protein n=1 Tax=candidate division WS2 bacterium ADurb.Bin280 TaxID=1852829 RepID=A0A1V5SF95_9BACT|nr:MAG: hypothetical protein BWY43_00272 [candidate division WS2 bacterium ADurb.Bin280]